MPMAIVPHYSSISSSIVADVICFGVCIRLLFAILKPFIARRYNFWVKVAVAQDRMSHLELEPELHSPPQEHAVECIARPPKRTAKVAFESFLDVAGVDGEFFIYIFFKINNIRKRESLTSVQLTVEQVDFGVITRCNCHGSDGDQSCNTKCDQIFVHESTIEACPDSWAQDCHRVILEPSAPPNKFDLQSSLSRGVQVGDPRQSYISVQAGTTISRPAESFEFLPASRVLSTNSVKWPWKLSRFANGYELNFNEMRWGSRPQLGIRSSYAQICPVGVNAAWESPPKAERRQPKLGWNVKITIHTALLNGKKLFPYYPLTAGPTLSFEERLTFS